MLSEVNIKRFFLPVYSGPIVELNYCLVFMFDRMYGTDDITA